MASTTWAEGIGAIVLRTDLTLRKEILWESETASDAEVRPMEMKLFRETVLMIRPSATTAVAAELMAAAERLATSSRVKGHWELPERIRGYAFACCALE